MYPDPDIPKIRTKSRVETACFSGLLKIKILENRVHPARISPNPFAPFMCFVDSVSACSAQRGVTLSARSVIENL